MRLVVALHRALDRKTSKFGTSQPVFQNPNPRGRGWPAPVVVTLAATSAPAFNACEFIDELFAPDRVRGYIAALDDEIRHRPSQASPHTRPATITRHGQRGFHCGNQGCPVAELRLPRCEIQMKTRHRGCVSRRQFCPSYLIDAVASCLSRSYDFRSRALERAPCPTPAIRHYLIHDSHIVYVIIIELFDCVATSSGSISPVENILRDCCVFVATKNPCLVVASLHLGGLGRAVRVERSQGR